MNENIYESLNHLVLLISSVTFLLNSLVIILFLKPLVNDLIKLGNTFINHLDDIHDTLKTMKSLTMSNQSNDVSREFFRD